MSLFINKKRFPLIHEIFNDLLERIQLNKNYDGTFWYIVINNKDYIYTYHNENIISKPIYDSEHINKYIYEDIQKCARLSELRSRSSNEENYSDEKIYKFNIALSKDYNLNNQTNYFFNSLFNLKPLPNYFFHLQKYSPIINEIEEDITFSDIIKIYLQLLLKLKEHI